MKTANLIGLFILFFVSCTKKDEAINPGNSEVAFKNVSYGNDPQQRMDVYLPAGRSAASTKVLVLIHGGGWNSGDKSDFDPYIDSLKKRDPSYAVFNVNYRLAAPPHLFPAQENDIKAAIEFIYNKRNEYLISDKFVFLGGSAGAHLALLQAYKYASPVKAKAVIDFFGPTDLVQLYNSPPNPLVPLLLFNVTGITPAANPAIYEQSSPINFVSPQSPPTLIFQGGMDLLVPPSQSEMLKNKLQTAGVIHQYVFYPQEGHGWGGASLSDSFDKIQAFLTAYVN